MGSNVYGIDLGTNNLKVFCKSNGKILIEKNTIALINKNEIYAYGDSAADYSWKRINDTSTNQ